MIFCFLLRLVACGGTSAPMVEAAQAGPYGPWMDDPAGREPTALVCYETPLLSAKEVIDLTQSPPVAPPEASTGPEGAARVTAEADAAKAQAAEALKHP